jgi:hypothetical protein
MLLLKWRKIVWSKSSRYFLGTIQQINFHIMTQRCFMLCTTYTNVWSIICPLEVRCLTPLSVTAFVAEIGGPIEIHRPVASHLQTLSHNVLSSTPRLLQFPSTEPQQKTYFQQTNSFHWLIWKESLQTVIIINSININKTITFHLSWTWTVMVVW